jgi:hypothetical protein
MESPFDNARTLAETLLSESAKLELALDQQIGKLGSMTQPSRASVVQNTARFRITTVLLFWIGFALASLAAFAFGFLAGFH